MRPYTVHRNLDRGTALSFPYLLDVQDPLLAPEIASVPAHRLGPVAADLTGDWRAINEAIEMLFKGL